MKNKIMVLILVLLLSGCSSVWRTAPSNQWFSQKWQATDIEKEIEKREDLYSSNNENYFILAFLHTHPRNQRPDYKAAEKYLNEYLTNVPAGRENRHAQYIYHLLEKINAADEEISQAKKQLETQSTEKLTGQTKQAVCGKKLKTAQNTLRKSKKRLEQFEGQLEKMKENSMKAQDEMTRLQIENMGLKEQLENLSKLYIDLEKKRQVIQ